MRRNTDGALPENSACATTAKSKKLGLLGATMLVGMGAAAPAMAQQNPPPAPVQTASAEDTDEDVIVVTGSRIRRPALDSAVPITTVSAEELLSSGSISLGDALNNLPALRSTFSQSNSTRFIGTAGLNQLDLRGLGNSRTLVLVNGRRHITSAAGDYFVDTNTIPSELLERVDVVTGGSSAVYGSDAVAGVVNFVTRTDYEGLRFQGQTGVSTHGDRAQSFAAFTGGMNFAENRGNIAASVEYSKADSYFLTDRGDLTGAFTGRHQFNAFDVVAGFPNSVPPIPAESSLGDGIPDSQFFTDVRNNNLSDGGLISAVCNNAVFSNPVRCTGQRSGFSNAPTDTPLATTYVFMPDGSLIANPIEFDFRPFGSGNARGGLGSTLSNAGDLAPGLERTSINLLGHYRIADAFEPFFEAKYAHLDVFQTSSPSFWSGSIPVFFGGGSNLRCDNPFLTAQAYGQLQAIGRCSAAIAFGAPNPTTFNIARNNVDWGIRSEDNERDTYRAVAGVRGDFNGDWSYEIAGNYGRFEQSTTSLNNLHVFNTTDGVNFTPGPFLNALNAVRNGSGQIVCAINNDADPTNDDPNCVPLNPFGEGRSDPRAIDYVMTETFLGQLATETDFTAFVTGDSSQLFSLPGGPIGFAIGGEYRKEEASGTADLLGSSGATFITAIPPFDFPDLTVSEGFLEFSFPLLRDMPYADLLEFTAAGRRSEYNGNIGTADAYNLTGVYRPIEDITLRVAYGRSVRAPSQSDLFSPAGQNFAFINDPCDSQFINNAPNRAANCAAAGVPVGFVNVPAQSATLSYVQGGNSLLVPETSDSYTYGLVYEPQWAPGLAITLDYYDIAVENLINTLGAQQIINLCYDAPSLNNQYCPLVHRNAVTSEFDDPAVTAGPVNFARQTTKGIDLSVYYSHTFGNGDELSMRLIWAYVDEKNNFTDPTNPSTPNRQLSELGDPQYEWNASAAYKRDIVTVRGEVRWIGQQTVGNYEDQNGFNGQPPNNPDRFSIAWYDPVAYFDLRIDVDVTDNAVWYIGMDNVTDAEPPLGLLGTGGGSGIYDNVGSYLYSGLRLRF